MEDDATAEAACAKLMVRAMLLADRHEVESFVRLFHADASVERRGEVLTGLAAITRFMALRDTQRITCHVLSPPCIDVIDSQNAQGVAYFTLYEGRAQSGSKVAPLQLPVTVGEVQQTYRKGQDGWRIQSHRSVRIFQTPPESQP